MASQFIGSQRHYYSLVQVQRFSLCVARNSLLVRFNGYLSKKR